MTTIYLIRHSIKEREYGTIDSDDDFQLRNEKIVLSADGERKALKLANHDELKGISEVWASNYVRAIQTAKYICDNNRVLLNVSKAFDERHYGLWDNKTNKDEFWVNQFLNPDLKNENGESQNDVKQRMTKKIEEILQKNQNKKVAIVCHNACILFYLLKYCDLVGAKAKKKLTIKFKDKELFRDDIMQSPSMMKLEFNGTDLIDISYIKNI